MSDLSSHAPFVVTGGSGYAASWIVFELLRRGATVRATVRDPNNQKKCRHLLQMGEEEPGTLELAKADLLTPGAFDRVVSGAGTVFHTASPFIMGKLEDAEAQLIKPAVTGTRNVLESVNKASSVEKVVLTSSVAAVHGDAIELKKIPSGRFNEDHWNTTSSPRHQPYMCSKTRAEKAAWEMQRAQDRWKLATVNPGFVLGPSKTESSTSESIKFMTDLLRGRYRIGAPPVCYGIVDVRDVAKAHVEAAVRPVIGRHILVADSLTVLEISTILRNRLGDRRFPRRNIPIPLLYLFGPSQGFSWWFMYTNAGHRVAYDNTRSRKELGIEYTPVEDTLVEHAEQLMAVHRAGR